MAERPRELGDFKKARVNGGTNNHSFKDSHTWDSLFNDAGAKSIEFSHADNQTMQCPNGKKNFKKEEPERFVSERRRGESRRRRRRGSSTEGARMQLPQRV